MPQFIGKWWKWWLTSGFQGKFITFATNAIVWGYLSYFESWIFLGIGLSYDVQVNGIKFRVSYYLPILVSFIDVSLTCTKSISETQLTSSLIFSARRWTKKKAMIWVNWIFNQQGDRGYIGQPPNKYGLNRALIMYQWLRWEFPIFQTAGQEWPFIHPPQFNLELQRPVFKKFNIFQLFQMPCERILTPGNSFFIHFVKRRLKPRPLPACDLWVHLGDWWLMVTTVIKNGMLCHTAHQKWCFLMIKWAVLKIEKLKLTTFFAVQFPCFRCI